MQQVIKNLVYGRSIFPINTIIGGVSATVNTKEILASTLGIAVNRIRRFEIDGNYIKSNISDSYTIKDYAFQNNTNLTDFIDIDGRCTYVSRGTFSGTSSIINLHIPNAVLANSALAGSKFSNLLYSGDYLTFIRDIDQINVLRDTAFKRLNAPNLVTATGTSWLQGNTNITDLYTPNLKNLGSRSFLNCSKLNCSVSNFQNIETIGSQSFSGCTSQEYIHIPKLTVVNSQVFRYMTSVKSIILPNVIECSKDYTFQNASSCTLISMKKLKNFGDPAFSGYLFSGIKSSCKIEVNIALATSNAGSPDAALLWAKNNSSSIVEFYDDNGNYVSTL